MLYIKNWREVAVVSYPAVININELEATSFFVNPETAMVDTDSYKELYFMLFFFCKYL